MMMQNAAATQEADAIVAQILDPKTDGSRDPLYARLREIAPVHRSSHPLLPGWYLVSGYQNGLKVLMADVAEQNSQMLAAMNVEDDGVHDTMMRRWFGFRETTEEHDRIRKFLAPYFTVRAMANLRSEVQTLIGNLLDKIGDKKEFDVFSEFCFPLPSMVIARLLGIPMHELDGFQQLMEERAAMTARRQVLDSEARARRDEIAGKFLTLFGKYLDLRRTQPAEDLISRTGAAAPDAGISDEDLLAQYVFMLIAGHSTTSDAISNALIALDQNPDQRQMMIDGKVDLKQAADELIRFDSSIESATRYIKEDLAIDGVTIPAGSKTIVLMHSAHRDPGKFAAPDRLDLTRTNASDAFPFGRGRYFCLGQPLAKIEVEEAVKAILERYPHYRVKEIDWLGSFISHGPRRLILSV
jgi:pimeloyl-[acyl-carrier protein] synthase